MTHIHNSGPIPCTDQEGIIEEDESFAKATTSYITSNEVVGSWLELL